VVTTETAAEGVNQLCYSRFGVPYFFARAAANALGVVHPPDPSGSHLYRFNTESEMNTFKPGSNQFPEVFRIATRTPEGDREPFRGKIGTRQHDAERSHPGFVLAQALTQLDQQIPHRSIDRFRPIRGALEDSLGVQHPARPHGLDGLDALPEGSVQLQKNLLSETDREC
jgi:hypothetical protein